MTTTCVASDKSLPGERNAKAWPKALLPLIQEISTQYQLNKRIKGIRSECLRQLSSGLWVSHNTIRIHATYHHCFAVLLSSNIPITHLYSPMYAGGRFDHNFDIWRAYGEYADFAGLPPTRPPSVQSSHSWLNGFEPIVRKCTAKAESELLPFYLGKLTKGRAALYALIDRTLGLFDQINPDSDSLASPVLAADGLQEFADHFHLSSDVPEAWDLELVRYWNLLRESQRLEQIDIRTALRFRTQSINLKATDIANMPPRLLEIPENIRNTCIAVNNFEHFLPIRAELPSILDLLMKL